MKGTIRTKKVFGDDGRLTIVPLYFIDGKEVTEEVFLATFPDNKTLFDRRHQRRKGRGWPLHSLALACDPSERSVAEEDARKKGVPTNFDSEGRPILTGRAHRAAFFKAYGWFDKDAGYGDAAKGSFKG